MLYTRKLNLSKPEDDDGLDACRNNWDKLDTAYSGALWVPAGFTPSNDALFDGAIVAEVNTGIVWRAERTANGNFVKRYLKYPYLLSAQTYEYSWGVSSNVYTPFGWLTYQAAESVNVDPATDLANSYWNVPITGIYAGQITHHWQAVAGGFRVLGLGVNSVTATAVDYEDVINGNTNDVGYHALSFNAKFTAGDKVISLAWQNSGVVPVIATSTLRVALVEVL